MKFIVDTCNSDGVVIIENAHRCDSWEAACSCPGKVRIRPARREE